MLGLALRKAVLRIVFYCYYRVSKPGSLKVYGKVSHRFAVEGQNVK